MAPFGRFEGVFLGGKPAQATQFMIYRPLGDERWGCCKLKTCDNPGSRSDPNFPVFMPLRRLTAGLRIENATRPRGKGNFQGAEARKCNSPFHLCFVDLIELDQPRIAVSMTHVLYPQQLRVIQYTVFPSRNPRTPVIVASYWRSS